MAPAEFLRSGSFAAIAQLDLDEVERLLRGRGYLGEERGGVGAHRGKPGPEGAMVVPAPVAAQ
jgi:hypothetical protein